jgi:hypothetical protein
MEGDRLYTKDPGQFLYQDLTEVDRGWALKMLVPQWLVYDPAQEAPDKSSVSEFESFHYLKLTKDLAVEPFVQDAVIGMFQELSEAKIQVTELPLGHSAMYFDECIDWVANILGL